MYGALTALQFEVMRRVRDCTFWSEAIRLEAEFEEVVFLCGLKLIRSDGTPGSFELTELGREYLSECERSLKRSAA